MGKPYNNKNKKGILRTAFATVAAASLLLVSQSSGPLTQSPSPAPTDPGITTGFTVSAKNYPSYHGIRLHIDDPVMLKQVRDALALMKDRAPAQFQFVQHYIKEIKESPKSGMDVYSGTFELSKVSAAVSPEWAASIIYHDSIHRYQYMTGQPYYGPQAEKSANTLQLAFLKKINAPAKLVTHLEQVMAKGDHSDLDGDGKYTPHDYELRNW